MSDKNAPLIIETFNLNFIAKYIGASKFGSMEIYLAKPTE